MAVAILFAVAHGAACPAQAYTREEACSPDFALERLARSDMSTLVDIADQMTVSVSDMDIGFILEAVYDQWGFLGHYQDARDAVVDQNPDLDAKDVDAAIREVLRYTCETMPNRL